MAVVVEFIKALVYGLCEGITEWLPISSTGHLLLLQELMPLNVSQAFWEMFLVVIQLGAILAVPVYFFQTLNPFDRHKSPAEKTQTFRLWGLTIISCIPAAIIGIPLDNWIEEHLSTPAVIAATLALYGVIFIVIEGVRARRGKALLADGAASLLARGKHFRAKDVAAQISVSEAADSLARVQDIAELDLKTALGIGLFQVLSIIPGTSRSGSTIIGGLLLGCSRAVAAEFTFFLAIPVMFGASALRLVKFVLKGVALGTTELATLVIACAVAFAVSVLAIRMLMSFVKRHSFAGFGVYRVLLALAVLVFLVV